MGTCCTGQENKDSELRVAELETPSNFYRSSTLQKIELHETRDSSQAQKILNSAKENNEKFALKVDFSNFTTLEKKQVLQKMALNELICSIYIKDSSQFSFMLSQILAEVIHNQKQIKSLYLDFENNIGDLHCQTLISVIANQQDHLKEVWINFSGATITQTDVYSIFLSVQNLSKLQKLYFNFSETEIDKSSIEQVPKYLKDLENIQDIEFVHDDYNNIYILREFFREKLGLQMVKEEYNITHYKK